MVFRTNGLTRKVLPQWSPRKEHDVLVSPWATGSRAQRDPSMKNRNSSCFNRKLTFVMLVLFMMVALQSFLFLISINTIRVDTVGDLKSSSTSKLSVSSQGAVSAKKHRMEVAVASTSQTGKSIPKILLFTHFRNLLKERSNLTDEEEIVLSENIRKGIALHTDETLVRFLTDEDCVKSLNANFPSLVEYFMKETQGMFKADICRGSALYESGGIYLDVDVGVRKDLWEDLQRDTEFVTALVHAQSKYPKHFFQAILGAAPKSPIIYKYLELFHDHYTGKERVAKGPLGVILLRRAWDRVYNTSTHSPSTELYQEVLYNQKLFPNLHPAPTWGTRRACHFVVVAAANSHNHSEFRWNHKDFHIPLYSRIAGSRMCPKS